MKILTQTKLKQEGPHLNIEHVKNYYRETPKIKKNPDKIIQYEKIFY